MALLQEKVKRCTDQPSEGSRQRKAHRRWKRYNEFFEAHSDFEDNILFPAMEKFDAPKVSNSQIFRNPNCFSTPE